MLKKIFCVCVFLLSILFVSKEHTLSNDFNLIDLVHAQESSNEKGDKKSDEKSDEKYYVNGHEMVEDIPHQVGVKSERIFIRIPGVIVPLPRTITYPVYEYIDCCRTSNNDTACNFNDHDKRC